MKQIDKPFILKDLKFSFNLNEAKYELDVLQNRLLEFYLRSDSRFRKAFSYNYTNEFFQFIRDKARLKEPVSLSMLGVVRSGKSYTGISIASYNMACYEKLFGIDYICANAFEFLEKLKSMPEDKLINSCFLIDEEKQTIFGVGSIAKKMKLVDVQNIIAINNISTIMINPISWANKEAMYGIRTFGRCFKTKTIRCMLYNLQEKGKGGELPMGCVYLPIFTAFLPKDIGLALEQQYLAKKKDWVRGEMRGEGDVLYEIKKKSAENFMRDPNYLKLEKKAEKMTYIAYKMGSEWSKGEIEEIFELTKLMSRGVINNGS